MNIIKLDTTYWMQVSWSTSGNIRYHLLIDTGSNPLEFRYPFRVDPVYGLHDRHFGLLRVSGLPKKASGYHYHVMDSNKAFGTVFSGQKIE